MILPNEFIEQVKNASNIVTVAGRYLPLVKKGRDYWACCPFHHEKTPSFAISEERQFFHCYGCKESGNVIKLVQHMENIEFLPAVELLAKWANIPMPAVEADPAQIENAKRRAKLLEILDEARQWYISKLDDNAKKYLHGRGISDELVREFNIGFCPDWNGCIDHLRKKGFAERDMLDAGVVKKSPKNNRIYDAMAERIVFSIFDHYGNCIGFTGRVQPAKDNGEIAKYLNTAQTDVFDKGKIVYGGDVLKKYMRTTHIENLIVVEGNVDAITLVANGFPNTVATMGTAMTQYHIKVFPRFSHEIYLCYDGDTAGRKATMRALEIFRANDPTLSVRVIELPADTDPDSFVRKNGAAAFKKLFDTARPSVDYRLDKLAEGSKLGDNIGKAKYLKDAVAVLKEVDKIELELYAPKVAKTAGVSKESILREVGVKVAVPKAAPPKPLPAHDDALKKALRYVDIYEQRSLELRGTNEELKKEYDACKQFIHKCELKKKRQEIADDPTLDPVEKAKQMNEINKEIKNGNI